MPARNPYSPHPGVLMMAKWEQDLPAKTGRSLDEWIALVEKKGPVATSDRRAWLKKTYRLGTNVAGSIVERAEGRGLAEGDPKAYLAAAPGFVDAMFSGPRAMLRPVYEALLKFSFSLGKDVKVSPGRTIIPFYRTHVFAQVKPTTQTRVDLGLCLRGEKGRGRLVETGGEAKGDRITHRIGISALDEIDREVQDWMRKAYDADA